MAELGELHTVGGETWRPTDPVVDLVPSDWPPTSGQGASEHRSLLLILL